MLGYQQGGDYLFNVWAKSSAIYGMGETKTTGQLSSGDFSRFDENNSDGRFLRAVVVKCVNEHGLRLDLFYNRTEDIGK